MPSSVYREAPGTEIGAAANITTGCRSLAPRYDDMRQRAVPYLRPVGLLRYFLRKAEIMLTRRFFSLVLQAVGADCVCDIGSRDGEDALFFRSLLPDATVLAFEASPTNFAVMAADQELKAKRVKVFPYAIGSRNGRATFHVTDDETDLDLMRKRHEVPPNVDVRKMLRGTNSLLTREGISIKETVEVPMRRIDEFILTRHPSAKRIGLWIDVEGAEHDVLHGIAKISDRIVALHVETARTPIWIGQRATNELKRLMKSMDFRLCGSNISKGNIWGDVVFVNRRFIKNLGPKFHLFRIIASLGAQVKKVAPRLDQKLVEFRLRHAEVGRGTGIG